MVYKMVELSIHRALAKLKIYDKQIRKEIANSRFIEGYIGENGKIAGVSQEETSKKIEGDYKSIIQLISNYEDIKGAIIKSNAGITKDTTGIKEYTDVIKDKSLTMAQILDIYNNSLKFREALLNELNQQYANTKNKVEKHNVKVDQDLNLQLQSFTTNKDQNNKSNSETEGLKAFAANYHNIYDANLLDPLNLGELIKTYDKELDELREKIDSTISENNALVTISVDL